MKTQLEFDTDVLIVGTGPTGATAALALATQGVRVHMLSRWNWLANTPRAHITNQRAVEVLRDLGVEEEAAKYAVPGAKWAIPCSPPVSRARKSPGSAPGGQGMSGTGIT